MYKVAIIDDEPLIVEGLCRTMPWEKWDCQLTGFAYNGKEGLEMIRKERPDIIISDINMPELDGLKMIAALKSEFPDMQLIILTGYREFEYARGSYFPGCSPIPPETVQDERTGRGNGRSNETAYAV